MAPATARRLKLMENDPAPEVKVDVPQYVSKALEASIEVEVGIEGLVAKREPIHVKLREALLQWEEKHPDSTRRQKNSAIFASLQLSAADPTKATEYMRVAKLLSIAWRNGEKEGGKREVLPPLRVPHTVTRSVNKLQEELDALGWECEIERKKTEIVIRLYPAEEEE